MCCILLAVFIIIGFQISSVDENSSTLESCMDDWVPSAPAPQQWKPNGFAVLALPFSQFATSHKNQNQNNQTLTLSTMINTKPRRKKSISIRERKEALEDFMLSKSMH